MKTVAYRAIQMAAEAPTLRTCGVEPAYVALYVRAIRDAHEAVWRSAQGSRHAARFDRVAAVPYEGTPPDPATCAQTAFVGGLAAQSHGMLTARRRLDPKEIPFAASKGRTFDGYLAGMKANVVKPLEDCVEDTPLRGQLYGTFKTPMEKFIYARELPLYMGHAADTATRPWMRPDSQLDPHWQAGCAGRLFKAGAYSALADKIANADTNGLVQDTWLFSRLLGE